MEENTKRNKPEVDFGRVSMLLSIIQTIPGTLPQMTHISSAAAEEVKEINDGLKVFAQEETKRLAEEASIAKATALRAAQEEADEEAEGEAILELEDEGDDADQATTVDAEKEFGVDLSGDGLVGGGVGGNTDKPKTKTNPVPRRV